MLFTSCYLRRLDFCATSNLSSQTKATETQERVGKKSKHTHREYNEQTRRHTEGINRIEPSCKIPSQTISNHHMQTCESPYFLHFLFDKKCLFIRFCFLFLSPKTKYAGTNYRPLPNICRMIYVGPVFSVLLIKCRAWAFFMVICHKLYYSFIHCLIANINSLIDYVRGFFLSIIIRQKLG